MCAGGWEGRNSKETNEYTQISHLTQSKKNLTRLSAPALELNRVAVTTRRFLGSTAPTATSGVSTIATNLGGAVNSAARPYLGVEDPGMVGGTGLIGVVGVRLLLTLALVLTLRRPLLVVGEGAMRDTRLVGGGAIEAVERLSIDVVRGREGTDTGTLGPGESGPD